MEWYLLKSKKLKSKKTHQKMSCLTTCDSVMNQTRQPGAAIGLFVIRSSLPGRRYIQPTTGRTFKNMDYLLAVKYWGPMYPYSRPAARRIWDIGYRGKNCMYITLHTWRKLGKLHGYSTEKGSSCTLWGGKDRENVTSGWRDCWFARMSIIGKGSVLMEPDGVSFYLM